MEMSDVRERCGLPSGKRTAGSTRDRRGCWRSWRNREGFCTSWRAIARCRTERAATLASGRGLPGSAGGPPALPGKKQLRQHRALTPRELGSTQSRVLQATSESIHPEGQRGTALREKRWCLIYISPPGLDDDFIAQPLGIISIGAILKQQGIEVQCRDERIHSEEELRDAIAWADVVGFSAMTPFVLRAIRWARLAAATGDKIIMMGGP